MKTLLSSLALVLVAFSQISAAMAVGDGDVAVHLEASKVVAQAGGESLQPATAARPGDTVEYRATYTNRGKSVARNVEATLPIPAGTLVYLPATARPAAVLASLDSNQFAPVPLTRTVIRANGTKELQPVPYAEYRYLRWTLGDLAPGASTTVRARMNLVNGDKQP